MKKLLTLTIGSALVLSLVGCQAGEKEEVKGPEPVKQESLKKEETTIKSPTVTVKEETPNSNPIIVEEDSVVKKEEPSVKKEEQTEQKVQIYRSNADATGTVAETIAIESNLDPVSKVKKSFELLKSKSSNKENYSVVPENIKLNNAIVKGNTLTLDFSSDVLTIGGSTGELMFVEGVNKTMFALLPEVNHIQYFVDGEKVQTLSHLEVGDGFNN